MYRFVKMVLRNTKKGIALLSPFLVGDINEANVTVEPLSLYEPGRVWLLSII